MIDRIVTNTDGTWTVVHPFTGHVEFTTTDPDLADEVRAVLDRHDPLTANWLYETLYQVPPHIRHSPHVEWTMSTATFRRLRHLKDSAGTYLTLPPLTPHAPTWLLGIPVRLDETAVGVTLHTPNPTRR